MELSYWEKKHWFSNIHFTIVGSGIVGLHCALTLRERYPSARILILEKGTLPQGASTKNAGFACFGSLSEIIADLKSHTTDEVVDLVSRRWSGLQLLRANLGDDAIGLQNHGGYELFFEDDPLFEECVEQLPIVNDLLRPIFKADVFKATTDAFGFGKVRSTLIHNVFESQIDTGSMMQALLRKAIMQNILIVNRQHVTSFADAGGSVEVQTNDVTFKTGKLLFATNGFAADITQDEVLPARAQVLITEPIDGLPIKGTFHMDQGYYYFRNIDDRILFGGGRNLDFDGETTTDFGQTSVIQEQLENILRTVILPSHDFKIEHRWSGIMGMGEKKSPIIRQILPNVYCGVRLGGMGVAIGSLVGKELAELV